MLIKVIAGALFVVVVSAGALAMTWSSRVANAGTASAIAGVVRVLDGDTIDVAGIRVRLEGIDAPEVDQRCHRADGSRYLCGIAASKALRALIGSDPVSCESLGKDSYGRVLGVCRKPDGLDLNAELVRRGLVVAFRRYSMRYAAIEDGARKAGIGLWAGSFEHPGCFRAARAGRLCKDVLPTS